MSNPRKGVNLPERSHHKGTDFNDPALPAGSSVGPVLGNIPPSPDGASSPNTPSADIPETAGETATGIVEDPVEILVRMAERGEIDPWNINIIEVTDKFLSELERCRQLNLQISGRTLFFAATLLRMKSEHLELLDVTESDDEGDGDDLFGDDYGQALDSEAEYSGRLGPIERLEHEIQRRLDRKNMRKSPVTLFELNPRTEKY